MVCMGRLEGVIRSDGNLTMLKIAILKTLKHMDHL